MSGASEKVSEEAHQWTAVEESVARDEIILLEQLDFRRQLRELVSVYFTLSLPIPTFLLSLPPMLPSSFVIYVR